MKHPELRTSSKKSKYTRVIQYTRARVVTNANQW